MLFGQEKTAIDPAGGQDGTRGAERCLRTKMNKAEITELIPLRPVYPGVGDLLRHAAERP